jgi:Fic family protein
MSTVPRPNSVLASSSEIAGNKARTSQIQSSLENLSSYVSDQAIQQGEEERKPLAKATNYERTIKRQTTIYDAVAGNEFTRKDSISI